MADSPRHCDVLTNDGVIRVGIRYMRPFRLVFRVEAESSDE